MKTILNTILFTTIAFASNGCSDKSSEKKIQCEKNLVSIQQRLDNKDESAVFDLIKWEKRCKKKSEESWSNKANFKKDPSKYKKTTRHL